MTLIPALILMPLLSAILISICKKEKIRSLIIYVSVFLILACTAAIIAMWLVDDQATWNLYTRTSALDHLMQTVEIALMLFIIYQCFIHRKKWIALFSIAQTALMLWVEQTIPLVESTHTQVDALALLMCVICAVVGGLIAVYASGYMKSYHQHHREYTDRSSLFLSMLFVFMSAMFGLVLSSNLIWIYFFWEITSVISFILIGYTRTQEAVDNSFRALWMNLLGGLGFAIAIWLCALNRHSVQLSDVIDSGNQFIIACLALAGLTKSAQLPFSTWLYGAMVAPTPSSALLHSATMVKAGVYLLIRLSPALYGTLTGAMVAFIGGFTFIAASMMAIAQNDAKKVLAFSTVSNLGLIVACAGIGVEETVWAAILLMIFHSVSKSMLLRTASVPAISSICTG